MSPTTPGVFSRAIATLRGDCAHSERVSLTPTAIADLTGSRAVEGADLSKLKVSGVVFERCTRCGDVYISGAPTEALGKLAEAATALVKCSPTRHLVIEVGDPPASKNEAAVAAVPTPPQSRASPPPSEASITNVVGDFESRVTAPTSSLDDVILADDTQRSVVEALEKVRSFELIYRTWGFEAMDPKGRSITMNFYGPSGTGKTRTAEAMAHALGLRMLKVSAADVEARYFGESPKNVRAIFQAARVTGALLFFDEADALFGRRASEVTQGVDHEVNAVKTTLLTELDAFDGVVILATNLEEVIDPAFLRRIAWHIHFRKPDREARRRLWELHLVPGIPLGEPRTELVEFLVDASEGRAGGDILTALRIGLPAAVRRCAGLPRVEVTRSDLEHALDQVESGYRNVGVRKRPAALPAPRIDRQTVEGESSSDLAALVAPQVVTKLED